MEEEREALIALDTEDMKNMMGYLNNSLVGKRLPNQNISKIAIKNAMDGAWRIRGELSVEVIGKNMFLFKFDNQEDRDWVKKNGPWLFYKNLLILEKPNANQRTTDMEFKKEAFWIRSFNLPLGFKNKTVAEKVGNNLGDFIDFNNNKEAASWRNSIRIRVNIDITTPL